MARAGIKRTSREAKTELECGVPVGSAIPSAPGRSDSGPSYRDQVNAPSLPDSGSQSSLCASESLSMKSVRPGSEGNGKYAETFNHSSREATTRVIVASLTAECAGTGPCRDCV